MDAEGYYTAQFEGKTGQVPANFIQEVDVSDLAMKNRLFNQVYATVKWKKFITIVIPQLRR